MPPDRERATLLDLRIAAKRIIDFVGEQDFASFSKDLKTQSAVTLQILILGEATKRLSSEFRSRHPEIPWSDIMQMRDKLIHHYEKMDLVLIWQTATMDVPNLLEFVEQLIPKEGEPH